MLCILPDSCVAFICVTFYPNNLMISCSVQYSFYHSSWTIHNSLLRCPLKLIRSSIFPVCLSTAYHFSTGKYICIDIFYFGAAIIICSTTAFSVRYLTYSPHFPFSDLPSYTMYSTELSLSDNIHLDDDSEAP